MEGHKTVHRQYSLVRLLKLHQAYESDKHISRLRRNLRNGQHPNAVVVCCSDSRVPPEVIFRLGCTIGVLFVVRSAGHVLDKIGLESVTYAVETLRVRLVIVLGHDGCGAVKSACDCAFRRAPALCPYKTIMASIISTFDVPLQNHITRCIAMSKLPDTQLYELATQCNVSSTASVIREQLSQYCTQEQKLIVVGYIHGQSGELTPVE